MSFWGFLSALQLPETLRCINFPTWNSAVYIQVNLKPMNFVKVMGPIIYFTNAY